jgi:[acyl-carrier-protein] S-malonyltransferase
MLAVVFPGQGSQAPGMGKGIFEAAPGMFAEVSQAVGFDVAELCLGSDEETLRQTQNAQIALYTVSTSAFRILADIGKGLPFRAAAGHSVGEYAALAAASVFTIGEGARLVQRRGDLMAQAGKTRPGTMAAVLGLDRETVEAECKKSSGVCVVANDNCPGQLVISGEVDAVAQVSEALKVAGAKRVLPLNVSGAFHSPLMEEPAKELGEMLRLAPFDKGGVPVYSNVTAKPGDGWPHLLEEQLKSPVRWTETVQNMVADGVDVFIECGHGSVLGGLIKRIAPTATTYTVSDPESAVATVEALKERAS